MYVIHDTEFGYITNHKHHTELHTPDLQEALVMDEDDKRLLSGGFHFGTTVMEVDLDSDGDIFIKPDEIEE
jgi:hypothetical protein